MFCGVEFARVFVSFCRPAFVGTDIFTYSKYLLGGPCVVFLVVLVPGDMSNSRSVYTHSKPNASLPLLVKHALEITHPSSSSSDRRLFSSSVSFTIEFFLLRQGERNFHILYELVAGGKASGLASQLKVWKHGTCYQTVCVQGKGRMASTLPMHAVSESLLHLRSG